MVAFQSIEALGDFFSSCDKDILRHSLIEAGFDLIKAKANITAKGFFAPRIPILLNFWEGEEDIPSACQILFDSTISEQMHIEDSAALCNIIKNQVINQYNRTLKEAKKSCQSISYYLRNYYLCAFISIDVRYFFPSQNRSGYLSKQLNSF